MVNREHVYMPSSVSVTSLRLMVSSAVVAWTSSIRLSRRAARKRERERERARERERERERGREEKRERERERVIYSYCNSFNLKRHQEGLQWEAV
jgi:hypothetical protein